MRFDALAVRLRPRTGWESVDLGCRMAREWYGRLWLSWVAVSLPVFLLAQLVFQERGWLAALIVWWLKPLFERAPLHLLSRWLFGEPLSVRDALRAWPRLAMRQSLAWLSWRRLSPGRSFVMPVDQLEQLTGSPRQRRLSVLQRKAGQYAFWLTVVGIHVEAFLQFSAVALLYLLVPREVDVDWWVVLLSSDATSQWINNLMAYGAMSLVAPFYVSGGFALYISRRSELEGWDIEIAFRGLRERLRRGGMTVAALLCLAVVLVPAGLGPVPARADAPVDRTALRETVEAVYNSDEFHRREEQSHWELIRKPREEKEAPEPWKPPEWFVSLITLMAWSFRWVVIALTVTVLALFLWRYRASLAQLFASVGRPRRHRVPPRTLFGLDVAPESLPDDVAAAAWQLWQAGEHREALGLLYRGSLSVLIHDHQLPVREGHTEGECVRLTRQLTGPALADQLQTVAWLWQSLAYGHRRPATEQVARACETWPRYFGPRESEPGHG